MSAYKLAIFDFDGTLADSAPWFMRVLNQVADRHGFRKVSEEEIEMLRGRPNREIISYLGVKSWQLPFIARDMRKLSAEAATTIPLFPQVTELLDTLHSNGVAVGIVSSNAEATIRRILGESESAVSHYECGVSLFGKARKLNGLRRRLGVKPAEVLCIGDEVRDIEAARAAGLRCAAVTWGYATEPVLRMSFPDMVFTNVAELKAAFLDRGPLAVKLH